MTRLTARLLFAPVLTIAVAMLVKASSQAGDGFAAGLIALLAVVIQYLAAGAAETERWLPVYRAAQLAIAGLVLTLAVAVQSVLRGEQPLVHWPAAGDAPPKLGTLELGTNLAFELGIAMLVLGAGAAAIRDVFLSGRDGEDEGEDP